MYKKNIKLKPAPASIYRDLKDKEENKKKINQNIFENTSNKKQTKKIKKSY